MARVAEITVKQLPDQHMLTIRKTIDFFKEYADFMGSAVDNIFSLIEENGMAPSRGPIACFHNIELEALDVEIGFQIAKLVASKGNVIVQTLPLRTVAITIDRGPYEKQDSTLEELMKWIPENGYEAMGGVYYHYMNGEEQPQSEYLIEMSMPIKKAMGIK